MINKYKWLLIGIIIMLISASGGYFLGRELTAKKWSAQYDLLLNECNRLGDSENDLFYENNEYIFKEMCQVARENNDEIVEYSVKELSKANDKHLISNELYMKIDELGFVNVYVRREDKCVIWQYNIASGLYRCIDDGKVSQRGEGINYSFEIIYSEDEAYMSQSYMQQYYDEYECISDNLYAVMGRC